VSKQTVLLDYRLNIRLYVQSEVLMAVRIQTASSGT